MNKSWEILANFRGNFIIKNFNFERATWQLIFNRGLAGAKEIEDFFEIKNKNIVLDPYLFASMSAAVSIIVRNIKEKNKIIIYGDYDADGVTACAILAEILKTLMAEVDVYIPERVSEGYGLNNKSIDIIAEAGVKLIITVDCGIRNRSEVEYAKSKGLDIIITDHHVPPENKNDWPACLIIDPWLPEENYPFKYLSGAGIAFKLGKAVLTKSKLTDDIKEKLEYRVLDLLGIGTVADCVSLLGENRKLVKMGLEVLNMTKRIGLAELINVAKLGFEKKIDTWNISFQIAPRLNAAGRMEHANTAYKLLVTKDKEEATVLASKLNENNIARQKNTEEIMLEAEKQIQNVENDKIFIGICTIDEAKEEEVWNEGVIGLVAGKICEKYYLPTLIITKTKDGYKGSGRSIPEFDLIKAIEESSAFLEKYGGHPAACGFSLKNANLENFKNKIKTIAREKLTGLKLEPKLAIEAKLDLEEITAKLVKEIKMFEPFGQNNERPKFASYDVIILNIANMGNDGQHIKFRIKTANSEIFTALGFGQTEKWSDLRIGDKIDIVYFIELNEFNGRSEIQLKIIDIKKHGREGTRMI